jgi:hypothetical protein
LKNSLNALKMKEFVVVLFEKNRDALAEIRTLPKLAAAVFEENEAAQIWLRGIFEKERLPSDIQKLPIIQYFILNNGLLFPINGTTPVGKLPNLTWQLLTDFITIEVPKSALPAVVDVKTGVRLVVSEQEQRGVALLTDFKTWFNYVETAPEIRLNQLKFAVSERGEVVVLGDILPPINGQQFWQDEQILLPCGKAFEWSITARLLAKKYKLTKRALLLFDDYSETKLPQRIDLEDFMNCTRSAVRLTQQNNQWIISQK